MRDTSERVAGTAKGNHQLRRRRTEEGGTRHGKPKGPIRQSGLLLLYFYFGGPCVHEDINQATGTDWGP